MLSSFFPHKGILILLLLVLFPLTSFAVSIPSVWNVPAENHNFVGRENVLSAITELFTNAPSKTAVLCGSSGFGKSQIAKHYIYKNYPQYDVVWWFKGNQYFEHQFEEFALEVGANVGLNLDQKIKTIEHGRLINIIKGAIRKKRLKCLIIFDDVKTYPDIEPYIPFSHEKNIHVLITTKNANFSANAIQVNSFKREESIAYIHRFFPHELHEEKNKLASHLADCPASIALAVDYIKNYPGMTIESYIHKHNKETATSPQLLSEVAEKLGGPIDGYATDLFMAIKMSLEDLRQSSQEAFQLIGFLSLLNHAEIDINLVKQWLVVRHIDEDMLTLMSPIKKYSFIETTTLKDKKKVYMSMHELIQKIIGTFISIDEKKKLIDESAHILMKSFSDRSDLNVETILKDTSPLLHTIKISEEADRMTYHLSALSSLRVRAFDVLLCGLRDPNKAKVISEHLQKDLDHSIVLPLRDQILYYINLSVLSAMHSPDYKKALAYGKKASKLIETEDEMYEEKIRLIANQIQYYSLIGNLENCEPLVKRGKALLPLSQSIAYNILYIYATTMYLIDKGNAQNTIDLILNHKSLLEKLDHYPSIRFYILNQLAEAFLKQGDIEKCTTTLEQSEKDASEFYVSLSR